MTPLEFFLSHYINFNPASDLIYEFEEEYEVDNSEWVYVDGEEGDHGIEHYTIRGTLVAHFYCAGGDSEWYEYTPEGITYFKKLTREIFENILNEINEQ